MATFLADLWNSVFTPGPTPTLVRATNVSFLALQSILFILLVATWSIHLFILSFLSAGLWAAINWFVRELEEANERERAKQAKLESTRGTEAPGGSEGDDEEGGSGSGTETEDVRSGKKAVNVGEAITGPGGSGAPGLRPEAIGAELRKRRSIGEGSSTGELSTDSEWDKVEEAGEIKK